MIRLTAVVGEPLGEPLWAGDASARGWQYNDIKLLKSTLVDRLRPVVIVCAHL